MTGLELFDDLDITLPNEKEITENILKKKSNPKDIKTTITKQVKSKKLSLEDRLTLIDNEVNRVLGHYKTNTLVIKTKEELIHYIDVAIKNNMIAIDTETNNSLDPITCKLMGACIYTPTLQQAYVPINHINWQTNERLEWQLTEQDIKEQFDRLKDTFIIMHNGKFDYSVIKCTCNCKLHIDWDTMIGAKLIDENELSAGLKEQYINKIDKEQEKYSIDHLFENVQYSQVSPDIFALYAATDSYMTYKLYEYQKKIMESKDYERVYNLFKNIEMPCVEVVAEMQLNGIEIDQEYAQRLGNKYKTKLDSIEKDLQVELHKYDEDIAKWRLTPEANKKTYNDKGKLDKSKNEQLSKDVNLDSPTQLAILLYDIIGIEVIDKKKPRCTDKNVLKEAHLSLCDLMLKRKELSKLYNDFITNLPKKVNVDNRIHCLFNQYGAATGRFSSSEPNLQQIPSHAKDIRMLFKAKDGYKIIGGDFSAQEPRLTAFMSQDENMLNAYKEGRDLYSVIAGLAFGKPYEDCLEFYPEGTKIVIDGKEIICGYKNVQNKAGKERRTQAKSILLGLLYGRGVKSVGEQINKSEEEAQQLIDKFFNAFPSIEKWIDKVHKSAKKNGYVEDWYGRRRRLPDILLPAYHIEPIVAKNVDVSLIDFNPFFECKDRQNVELENKVKKYREKLSKTKNNWEVSKIIKDARTNDNLYIRSNSDLIAQAERQSVNSIIQGGAATLTKLAMVNIYNDKVLNDCKFKLLVTIHDEVLGECPEEYASIVEKRLAEVMIDSAKPYMNVPMSCDCYNVTHWYEDEYAATILAEYKKLEEKGVSKEEALNQIVENHTESSRETLENILK